MHPKGWGGGGTQPYTSQFSFLSSVTLWSCGLGNCPELRAGFYIQFYHWMQPSNSQHTDRSDSKAYALGASHPFHRVAAATKKHTACPDRKFLILFDIFLQCGICIYLQNQFFILKEKKAASLAIQRMTILQSTTSAGKVKRKRSLLIIITKLYRKPPTITATESTCQILQGQGRKTGKEEIPLWVLGNSKHFCSQGCPHGKTGFFPSS